MGSDRWLAARAMSTRRIGLGLVSLHPAYRCLYAIGGFDGQQRVRSVERYLPELDRWDPVAPMQQCRSGAAMVALGHHVYAIGARPSLAPNFHRLLP